MTAPEPLTNFVPLLQSANRGLRNSDCDISQVVNAKILLEEAYFGTIQTAGTL